MSLPEINLVWFKRDLRWRDHAPLTAAIARGKPLLLLYCFEPSLMAAPQSDVRHWRFIYESLQDLQRQQPHIPWLIAHAEVRPTLENLARHYRIGGLFAHQETGIGLTFDRDREVGKFCRDQGIPFYEFPQDGVSRARNHRVGWEGEWKAFMGAPVAQAELSALCPALLPADLKQDLSGPPLPGQIKASHPNFQGGGETEAWRWLRGFLQERCLHYSAHISKPSLSRQSCSRLSPYLAYGNLSARQVVQLSDLFMDDPALGPQLRNFRDRVWWRSHYMQKLESQYRIEWENLNPGFDDLGWETDPAKLEAWSQGRTGFPMVDASMRCLNATGYLNFRMRAMLATFWCFSLQQPWQPAAEYTARIFLDFEPGIHYGQWQMQSGMTGYHTLRIYNPTLQCERHDPEGAFIRQWVPELAEVPVPRLFEPWKLTPLEQVFYHCRIGEDYPDPIVDFEQQTRSAREAYWRLRQSEAVQAALPAIWKRHCLPQNVEQYSAALRNLGADSP